MPQRTYDIVVIGAGSMRTGTVTQKAALEILLGHPCYHMAEVMKHARRHIPLWIRATESGLTKSLAEEILKDYVACTDYPTASFYKELMQHYPNAKVILSVRDPDSWVESVQGSIMKIMHAMEATPRPLLWLLGIGESVRMIRGILRREFGSDVNLADSESMARRFEARNAAVRRAVPPEKLLVYRVSEGWGPLCEFLDLPVPDAPFPRLNDRQHVERVLLAVTVIGYLGNALLTAGCIGAAVWAGRRFLV